MKLPPLPDVMCTRCGQDAIFSLACGPTHAIQGEELIRAYGLACAEAMREECAKRVAAMPAGTWHPGSDQFGNSCPWQKMTTPSDCAAAIREIEVEHG